MAMAVGALLRGLVSPAGGAAAWLPCHELLASPSSDWLPHSLRLRPPFKLLLVLLLFSAALAEVRLIASSSMAPTLRPGDRAVAEKNYGLNKDVVFIKRVLATPGDFIEVRQGQLIINGVAQNENYTSTHLSYTMEAMVCCISPIL